MLRDESLISPIDKVIGLSLLIGVVTIPMCYAIFWFVQDLLDRISSVN